MIPYSYNMVDMGGIDLAEANGTVVEGLYNRLALARNACGDLILFNWKFADIEIAPSPCSTLDEGTIIVINGLIQVTEQDELTIPGINPVLVPLAVQENGVYNPPAGVDGYAHVNVNVPGAVVQPLSVTQNGTYNPPAGVDGYAPVAVDVSSGADPSLPSEYQEVEYITFDGNEFMLVENLPSDYLLDVVASNSVSMSESCVVGYREASNNDRDFEVRFQYGALNIWSRSSTYAFTVFSSNPGGSALSVVRDIVVSCIDHVRGKFFIGKYSTQSMELPFAGNLYAIKVYDLARPQGALTVVDASRKFIPCYRKLDGEIGVYEVYTSTFYPNEGTGTLTKGPDVN